MREEVLRQLFLVVPVRHGWAVNLGADTLRVFPTRSAARIAAMKLATAYIAAGEKAGWMDPDVADDLKR
jgi:hypothetical protein